MLKSLAIVFSENKNKFQPNKMRDHVKFRNIFQKFEKKIEKKNSKKKFEKKNLHDPRM